MSLKIDNIKALTDNMDFNKEKIKFQGVGNRKVIVSFDGGKITSDAGGLLLGEVESRSHILKKFSECFTDYRKYCDYSVKDLISQRILGIILGYEDLNDHEKLRYDPTLISLVGNKLAGKSTLNRLESAEASINNRYKKIIFEEKKIEDFFVEVFIDSFSSAPKEIILDMDATDDEIHGNQEGRFYQGYYGHYCYLPLYIFCGDFLLCAKLRSSNIDGAFGAKDELERIIKKIREKWPNVRIKVRGDGGFCRDEIMTWCEGNNCKYIVGMPKNTRLTKIIEEEMSCAKFAYQQILEPSRVFKTFNYRTLDSWGKERKVIAKAEHLEKGSNPRFIVTSLESVDDGNYLYEEVYCQRGEMENRIGEMKNDLFSGRTSCTKFKSNQLRLWFSAVAYALSNELRRTALKGTELAKAHFSTIREKIFKIGASVVVTATKIHFHFASSYPFSELFKNIKQNIAF